jgi:regulator of sirC expression with transglutaminase-like and TPR domain
VFSSKSAFQRFADIVSGPETEIGIAEAALVIASDFSHDLAISEQLNWIASAATKFPAPGSPKEISSFFCGMMSFRGSGDDYFEPDNYLLDKVIIRREGAPISLCILLLEFGYAQGWALQAVGVPVHSMVRDPVSRNVIDPFHGCEVMTDADAVRRVVSVTGVRGWRKEWLQPAGPRHVLFRLLTNLKLALLKKQQYTQAAAVQEKLLVLAPGRPQEYRDLGVVSASAGDWGMARRFLTEYLQMKPDADDGDLVRAQLQHLSDSLALRN